MCYSLRVTLSLCIWPLNSNLPIHGWVFLPFKHRCKHLLILSVLWMMFCTRFAKLEKVIVILSKKNPTSTRGQLSTVTLLYNTVQQHLLSTIFTLHPPMANTIPPYCTKYFCPQAWSVRSPYLTLLILGAMKRNVQWQMSQTGREEHQQQIRGFTDHIQENNYFTRKTTISL